MRSLASLPFGLNIGSGVASLDTARERAAWSEASEDGSWLRSIGAQAVQHCAYDASSSADSGGSAAHGIPHLFTPSESSIASVAGALESAGFEPG